MSRREERRRRRERNTTDKLVIMIPPLRKEEEARREAAHREHEGGSPSYGRRESSALLSSIKRERSFLPDGHRHIGGEGPPVSGVAKEWRKEATYRLNEERREQEGREKGKVRLFSFAVPGEKKRKAVFS